MINIKMQPTEVQKLSPKITVIGVGGAGGNAVNNMISSGLEGCEFLVCNTDAQALENSLCQNRMQLGVHVTGGLGAGSKPDIGRAAAEETLEEVMDYLEGANMVFVTAGMGGGTGTGAAPVIAKACRERGILTVGVVTKPFHFEGSHRMRMAESGLEEMQKYVDTLIVIPNQNLFRIANEKTTFAEAFKMADSVLQSGVRGVTDLMVRPGLINLDFADIRTAMMEMGKAMMGTGEATGDKRAVEAAEAAINNPLLDDISMKGAHGVIINVTGGYDMTLFEADEACNRIREEVDPNANIIFGATFDENMDGVMRVSIVATGIEKEAVRAARSGGGALKTDATGKAALERAKPNTEVMGSSGTPMTTGAPALPPTGYVSTQTSLRGITAPLPLSSASSAAPAQPTGEEIGDMFEQQKFTDASASAGLPRNTALRGTRYKNAFIPPRPVEVSAQERAAFDRAQADDISSPSVAQAPASSFHGAVRAEDVMAQTGTGSNLKLNPPRLPAAEAAPAKRSPSLFERITGTVQHHLEGIKDAATPAQPKQRTAPAPQFASSPAPTPRRAVQGSLNIDAPAAKPRSAAEEELDIPAFLRRQAN